MTYYKQYSNGLRLIVQPTPVRSVTIGVWVKAGSAYESDANNGISHFIEHMLFKGTSRRSAFDISKEIDDIGAQINAFTAHEYTCYYTKSVDEDAEKCFDVLSDMLYHSAFNEEELARERGVVLEEISMVEDSPEDVCQELLTKAIYGGGAYGRTILGTEKTVSSFGKNDIHAYMASRYVPKSLVVSVVGNITEDGADALVRRFFDVETSLPAASVSVHNPRSSRVCLVKDKHIEQTSIAVGFPGLTYNHPDSIATQIFSMALGGGMSSRLFQEVRERKGLAYAVYAYLNAGLQGGTMSVYCGTNPSKTQDALTTMMGVLRDVKQNGLSEEEFMRGKAQIRGAFLLGQESSFTLMNTVAKFMIQTDELYDFEAKLKELDAVTLKDVNRTVREVLDFDRACLSIVGVKPKNLMDLV